MNINKLKEAYKAATPGTWHHTLPGGAFGHEVTSSEGFIAQMSHHPNEKQQASDNAEFITLAHNAVPDLLELLAAIKQAVEIFDSRQMDEEVQADFNEAMDSCRFLLNK